MHGAIMIKWGANVPGREQTGLAVFTRAVGRFEDLAKQGRVQGHREYFSLTGHDGGFMLVEGEAAELTKILADEETLKLNAQAAAVVSDYEVQAYLGGTDQSVQELMTNYTGELQTLGYM